SQNQVLLPVRQEHLIANASTFHVDEFGAEYLPERVEVVVTVLLDQRNDVVPQYPGEFRHRGDGLGRQQISVADLKVAGITLQLLPQPLIQRVEPGAQWQLAGIAPGELCTIWHQLDKAETTT